jgi:hypothetical protein
MQPRRRVADAHAQLGDLRPVHEHLGEGVAVVGSQYR